MVRAIPVTGQGGSQDYVLAYKWLSLAAPRFFATQKEVRVRAVEIRDGIAAKMTPAQIAIVPHSVV